MIIFKKTPIRSDNTLDVKASGHVLSLNGEVIDLSGMEDGDTLPFGSVGHKYINGDIAMAGSDITVSIAVPYGAGEDPDSALVVGGDVSGSASVEIDWSQLRTATSKAHDWWLLFVEQAKLAVQSHVDDTARGRNYHDGSHLAGYTSSTVPSWSAEALAFVAWRDAVWLHVYSLWDQPPTDGEISVQALMATLPEIEWP